MSIEAEIPEEPEEVKPYCTYTITFGDQGENHVGMEKIGKLRDKGLSIADLKTIQAHFENSDYKTEYHCLNPLLGERIGAPAVEEAGILVVKNGLQYLVGPSRTTDDFFWEQHSLKKDTKAFMYGRVVDKKARHNLCFSDTHSEPCYEQGKGTVYAFSEVALLAYVREQLGLVHPDLNGLVAEGNYYNDPESCGIGFHGDSERRVVVGIRVGADLPLVYQWYYHGERVGPKKTLILTHGDVYFMSQKAVGFDWKKKVIYTLRHAAGSEKYTK